MAILAVSDSSAQVSDGVVKLGVLTDMSSVYADALGKGSVVAAQMAIDDFGGTVLGKPIELVFADHQNKPDVGSSTVRQWFDSEKVDTVIDVATSSVALAVQQIARDKKRIALMSGPASSDLTGKSCSPYTVHWTYDTYALAKGTGTAVTKQGGDSWFFVTADYAFGQALERDTTKAVEANGGKILGSVRSPLNSPDFSSFLLRAQASKARVVGFALAGNDVTNAIKQASEFGLVSSGRHLAGLLLFLADVHALGLQTAQGLTITVPFYWDMNDETRAFAKRFMARHNGSAPDFAQAGVYGATLFYLQAIKEAGTDDPDEVMAKMREMPINDFMTKNGRLREDGRVVRDMYLAQVKKPSDSSGSWDLLKILDTIPAKDAFRSLEESECPLVKK
ncbi:branched-chain amino acid transport system substrate-binding protein [Bradyrhizobium sp. USDA 326]|uniref:ABC transporter substrate-binding protein n=1 Tax=unclassified Bradyrhizobium TaxID=2631580 RepID=UPI003513AB8F